MLGSIWLDDSSRSATIGKEVILMGISIGRGTGGVVASAAGGALAGRYARIKDELRMAQQIQYDLQCLGKEGGLPPAQPLFRLTPRRSLNVLLCYLLGMAVTGFVAWLLTVIIAAILINTFDLPDTNPSERWMTPLFAGFVVGTVAAVVPGLLIGAAIWLREVKKRISEVTAVSYREYWNQRQHGAQALALGQATTHQVANVLARYIPASVPQDE